MLPGQDGFACCRRLREVGWRNPIIFLTGRANAVFKVAGLDSGADDYLIKPVDPTELLARIRAHMRRVHDYNRTEAGNVIALGGGLVLDTYAREARRGETKVSLTEREFELLMLLARSPGKAQERTWLFQQLWGCSPTEDMNALAVYVRRVREKIEVDANRPRLLQTVRGYGYKLVTDADPV
jgi:DNA-binding response OmpR family regulator